MKQDLHDFACDLLLRERRHTFSEFYSEALDHGYEPGDPAIDEIFNKAVEEHEKFAATLESGTDKEQLIEAYCKKHGWVT